MVKISAAIITFNEEENIERCIKSLIPVVDEIVVLDSFSTDKTEEICKSHNVHFSQHNFDGHIQQKNRVLEYTSNEFVLSVDADEVLSPELARSIMKIKDNPTADGYYFNRLNYYCGKWIKHGDWYPDRKLRLWKKSKGKWGGSNPHDTFIMDDNLKLQYLKGDLFHYTYNTIEQHIKQADKFSTIGAAQICESKINVSVITLILHPFWRFLRSYIFRLGFLDGYRGFAVSIISSTETYLKYLKAYHKQKIINN